MRRQQQSPPFSPNTPPPTAPIPPSQLFSYNTSTMNQYCNRKLVISPQPPSPQSPSSSRRSPTPERDDNRSSKKRPNQYVGQFPSNPPESPSPGITSSQNRILQKWAEDNLRHACPSQSEKNILAKETGLPLKQLDSWLVSHRQRRLKAMLKERGGMGSSNGSSAGRKGGGGKSDNGSESGSGTLNGNVSINVNGNGSGSEIKNQGGNINTIGNLNTTENLSDRISAIRTGTTPRVVASQPTESSEFCGNGVGDRSVATTGASENNRPSKSQREYIQWEKAMKRTLAEYSWPDEAKKTLEKLKNCKSESIWNQIEDDKKLLLRFEQGVTAADVAFIENGKIISKSGDETPFVDDKSVLIQVPLRAYVSRYSVPILPTFNHMKLNELIVEMNVLNDKKIVSFEQASILRNKGFLPYWFFREGTVNVKVPPMLPPPLSSIMGGRGRKEKIMLIYLGSKEIAKEGAKEVSDDNDDKKENTVDEDCKVDEQELIHTRDNTKATDTQKKDHITTTGSLINLKTDDAPPITAPDNTNRKNNKDIIDVGIKDSHKITETFSQKPTTTPIISLPPTNATSIEIDTPTHILAEKLNGTKDLLHKTARPSFEINKNNLPSMEEFEKRLLGLESKKTLPTIAETKQSQLLEKIDNSHTKKTNNQNHSNNASAKTTAASMVESPKYNNLTKKDNSTPLLPKQTKPSTSEDKYSLKPIVSVTPTQPLKQQRTVVSSPPFPNPTLSSTVTKATTAIITTSAPASPPPTQKPYLAAQKDTTTITTKPPITTSTPPPPSSSDPTLIVSIPSVVPTTTPSSSFPVSLPRRRRQKKHQNQQQKQPQQQQSKKQPRGIRDRDISSYIELRSNIHASHHPHAPLGQIWLSSSSSSSSSPSRKTIKNNSPPPGLDEGGSLLGRKWVWDEGYFHDVVDVPEGKESVSENCDNCRAYCDCGRSSKAGAGRTRRSGGSSVKMPQVLSELASGKLNPHTLVTCEPYEIGPELRFVVPPTMASPELVAYAEERGGVGTIQPFQVRVNPDATFLADLHAHLADCEVIGLLGGRWVKDERCIYIQAAFPCQSTQRADSGSTDVEMDPVSQVVVRDAIASHGMSVLGWYHSHPTFQPDPSVTDIENQANYQNLFSSQGCPFVGLIIGTWDGRNASAESVMRWFHVIDKETGNVIPAKSDTPLQREKVNFPMKLRVTHRKFRRDAHSRQTLTSQGVSIRRNNLFMSLQHLSNLKSNNDKKMDSTKNIEDNAAGLSVISSITSHCDIGVLPPPTLCTVLQNDTFHTEKENKKRKLPHTQEPNKKIHKSQQQNTTTATSAAAPSNSSKNHVIQLRMPSDPLSAFAHGMSLTDASTAIFTSAKPSDATTDTELFDRLGCFNDAFHEISIISEIGHDNNGNRLADKFFQPRNNRNLEDNRLAPAQHLPFKEKELKDLIKGNEEERSKLIWGAVEREQFDFSSVETFQRMKMPQASSRSILDLLLLPPYPTDEEDDGQCSNLSSSLRGSRRTRGNSRKEAQPSFFSNDDAVLVSSIDAVLSYYATNTHRVNMMEHWNTIKKGQKLCISLLRWAKHMQLAKKIDEIDVHNMTLENNGESIKVTEQQEQQPSSQSKTVYSLGEQQHHSNISWDYENETDHGNSLRRHQDELVFDQFVIEVMRLLGAHWREDDDKSKKKRRKRARKGRTTQE